MTAQETPAQRELRVGTAKDVARLIGASLNTVYALAANGDIPTLRKIGPRLRFDLDAVEAWAPPLRPLTRDGRPRRVRLSKGVDWDLTAEQIDALPTDGWVYFIQSTRGGPVKIGIARDVQRRLADLQASSPFPLVILATMPGGRRLEYQLHRRFAEHRKHGEWFSERAPGLMVLVREAIA